MINLVVSVYIIYIVFVMYYIGENLVDIFNIQIYKNWRGGGVIKHFMEFLNGIKKQNKLPTSLPGCLSLHYFKLKL